ncbi:unnamed protein product, partial [Tilletia laevis]
MSSTTITITITTTQPDHDTLKDSFLALGHVVFGRDGKADSNVVMKTEAPAKETTLTIPHFTGLVGAAADDDATSAAAAPAQPSYGLSFLNKQPELNGAAPPVLDPKKWQKCALGTAYALEKNGTWNKSENTIDMQSIGISSNDSGEEIYVILGIYNVTKKTFEPIFYDTNPLFVNGHGTYTPAPAAVALFYALNAESTFATMKSSKTIYAHRAHLGGDEAPPITWDPVAKSWSGGIEHLDRATALETAPPKIFKWLVAFTPAILVAKTQKFELDFKAALSKDRNT